MTHFKLDGFSRESLADKRRLIHHPLPALTLVLSSFDDFKHFLFSDPANLWQRHGILCSAILSAILDS